MRLAAVWLRAGWLMMRAGCEGYRTRGEGQARAEQAAEQQQSEDLLGWRQSTKRETE